METASTSGEARHVPPLGRLDAGSALRFDDHGDYLRWELQRLKEQVDAYIVAREQPTRIADYHRLARDLRDSRLWAVEARREAVARGVPIPFDGLSRSCGLDLDEEALLLQCMTQHLSAPIWKRLLYAQGDPPQPYLEAGLALQLVGYGDHLLNDTALLEPGARLVQHGLVVLEQPSGWLSVQTGLLAHAVHTPHYVAAATLGRTVLDERLAGFCELREPSRELYDLVLAPHTQQTVAEFLHGFRRRRTHPSLHERPWALQLTGPRKVGKSTLAEAIARAFDSLLFVVNLPLLAGDRDPSELMQLVAHNAQLLDAVLLLSYPERLLADDGRLAARLTRMLERYRGLIVLESVDALALETLLEPFVQFSVELELPDKASRRLLWESHLPRSCALADDLELPAVAAAYELSGGQIRGAIDWACQRASMRAEPVSQADLEAGARSQLPSHLGQYTDASAVRLGLDHLVLPEEPFAEVEALLGACRVRQQVLEAWGFGERLVTGHGIVALFSGDAGTGKTLCAELLANALDLRLSIVSIPKIVSKWVGETEKNIRQVFLHARAENAMLLFDEADSLFGRRVSVERAQDQYQNMEVNNLLHEIERFDGIVILTTNLENNMDRAFQRRILFKIDFPLPEQEERRRIWRLLLPARTPVAGSIDFEMLADAFELSGGQIKNAVVRAAYYCCSHGHPVTEEALLQAAQQQARAEGQLTRSLEDVRRSWAKRSGAEREAEPAPAPAGEVPPAR